MGKKTIRKVVYQAKNKITGDFYIGCDSYWPSRIHHHEYLAKNGNGWLFQRALSKYGSENFEWTILEEVNDDSLYEKERLWIERLNPKYNLTEGGEGALGRKVSDETKELMSVKMIGNTNGKGNKGRRGKKHTEETKSVIREKYTKIRNKQKWSTKPKDGWSDKALEARKETGRKFSGTKWWNNGIKNVRAKDCPGEDFVRGKIKLDNSKE